MDATANGATTPAVSTAQARYALAVLTVIWMLNFIDRNIVNVLIESIKADLGLSDTAIGFVSGFGFVLLYSTAAIPLARLADNTSRTAVISGGLALWSVMTAVTGLAQSATQLILARSLVGIGEASTSGPSQALISDYYTPEKRARAMSVLSMGTFIGVFLSFAIASTINTHLGWRAAFVICGLPGVLVAALCWFTVKDIPRGSTEAGHVDTRPLPLGAAMRFMASQPSFRLIVAAFCCAFVCNAAILAFVAPLLQRVHHMTNQQVGLTIGPILGASGMTGAIIGIVIMTRLSRHDMRWLIRAPAIALTIGTPAALLFGVTSNTTLAIAGLAVATLCAGFIPGPLIAATQSIVKVRMRALSAATTLVFANLFGWGLGPLLVGIMSDTLAPQYGVQSVRLALLICCVAFALGAALLWLAIRFFEGDIARAVADGEAPA